jgi:glucose/arabinose dehydrogenase
MYKQFFLSLLITLLSLSGIQAQITLQDAFPNLTFSSPLFLTNAGDGSDRIFVVEQSGRIKVFPNSPSVSNAKIFLDITDRVVSGGEMGLLGLAFYPDYQNNGYFYVNYIADNPLRTIVSRFQVTSNPDSADKNSEFQILTFNQPYQNHNGGWISFRPSDGYLYIETGDGGSGGDPQNNGQSIYTMLGKILRIDVDGGTPYAIPTTNPFYDSTGNVVREIYAWGLRNPWRSSFDPVTDWFWCGDVGQDSWEEIDLIENGKNYGWRVMEGFHCYNPSIGCDTTGKVLPIWEYGHGPECSITGGYVYRGPGVPELVGKYIYGDYCSNKIWSLEYDGINPPTNTYLLTATGPLTSFGIDEQNELYLTSFNGKIYRFTPIVTGTEKVNIPSGYSLEQNYPNPFNPSTVIRYNIPEESNVIITVFNILGREIDTITNGVQQKGFYEKTWNASEFSSGIYYVKMIAKSLSSDKIYSKVIKMVYLK